MRLKDYMLIVGSPRGRARTPIDEYLERYDVENEDAAGRLPHEPGYGQPASHQPRRRNAPLTLRLVHDIRARLDELAPAIDEARRLEQALDKLRRVA